jgi:hypothetical protein
VIIIYYKYIKTALIKLASYFSQHLKSTVFTVEEINGTTELILIASSHVLFCFLLLYFIPPVVSPGQIPLHFYPVFFIFGIILGAGCLCLSGVFCQLLLQLLNLKNLFPGDLKSWLMLSRGGWIRHHLHALTILPFPVALLILLFQVGSEETIFRSLMISYFRQAGEMIALATSGGFFVLMQVFQMHSWRNAIFPVTGASVIAICHGILFWHVPILWPLIVAHVTFFLLAVI